MNIDTVSEASQQPQRVSQEIGRMWVQENSVHLAAFLAKPKISNSPYYYSTEFCFDVKFQLFFGLTNDSDFFNRVQDA